MFSITEGQLSDIMINITGLIGDLMPLVLLIMGVSIGLWIISALAGNQDDLTDDEIREIIRARRFKDNDF